MTLDDELRDCQKVIDSIEQMRQHSNLPRYSRMLHNLYRKRAALQARLVAAKEAKGAH